MLLPGLKDTIELETEPSLRLVDRTGGAALAVSETEVRLLQLWDGASSATELSARVFVEGLDVEPWQVEQFFTRLARAGLLAAATPVVPNFVPALPDIERPEDTVPRLRGDLIISRSAQSRGTVEVRDPASDRSFTLYDFEVSIARMLDGRRSASEVLAAANRLGIPVNLATLRAFLQQLRAYRFIDERVTGGDTTWPPRQEWTQEVRELYQSALRLLRQGRYDEALGYVEAMQAADPENAEAKSLRERIEAEARGSLELKVDFESLHTPPGPLSVEAAMAAPVPKDPFADFGFLTRPPPAEALAPMPTGLEVPASQPPDEGALDEAIVRPSPRRRLGFVAAGLAVVALLAFLFHPVPARRSISGELRARELALVRATTAGRVKSLEVKPGTRVDAGAVLARLERDGASPDGLETEIAALEQELGALPPAETGPRVQKARLAVKKARAAVTALEKQVKKARTRKAAAAVEKKLKPKQRALEAAEAALEALTHEGARERLGAALRERTAKKVAAQVEAERALITAPVAGVFVGELPEAVEANGAFGRIVAPELDLVLAAPLETTAREARFRTASAEVVVTFEGGAARPVALEPALIGARGSLELDEGSTPWLLH
ncbi:MAG: hypothetical protein ACOZQL_30815 [Myxococcota bacterium]